MKFTKLRWINVSNVTFAGRFARLMRLFLGKQRIENDIKKHHGLKPTRFSKPVRFNNRAIKYSPV
jgi:hypothetical protein